MNDEKILKVLEEIRDLSKENTQLSKDNAELFRSNISRTQEAQQNIQKAAKKFLVVAVILIAAFLFLSFF